MVGIANGTLAISPFKATTREEHQEVGVSRAEQRRAGRSSGSRNCDTLADRVHLTTFKYEPHPNHNPSPGSVAAYHGSLSSFRLGFKSRPGRYLESNNERRGDHVSRVLVGHKYPVHTEPLELIVEFLASVAHCYNLLSPNRDPLIGILPQHSPPPTGPPPDRFGHGRIHPEAFPTKCHAQRKGESGDNRSAMLYPRRTADNHG